MEGRRGALLRLPYLLPRRERMNRNGSLVLVFAAMVVLLITASAPAWRSEAAANQSSEPDARSFSGQSQLSQIEGPVPGGPGFYTVNAFAFRPETQATPWQFVGVSLVNPGQDVAFYWAPLLLPHGVRVSKLVVYYWDNDPNDDLCVMIDRISLADGTVPLMAEACSFGAFDGYRTRGTITIAYPVIDNQSYSYAAHLQLPYGPDLRFLAIRIDYGYGTSLPLIMRDR